VTGISSALYRAHAFAVAFAAYALGVVAACDGAIGWCAAFAATALTFALTRAHTHADTDLRALSVVVGCSFALGAGCAALALREDANIPFAQLADHHLVARVIAIERPRPTSGGQSVRVRIVEVEAPSGPAADSLRGAIALLDFPAISRPDRLVGRTLRVRVRLDMPAGQRNEGEPAERDILAEQGVATIFTAPVSADIEDMGAAGGWDAWWARLRTNCADAVEARLPPLE